MHNPFRYAFTVEMRQLFDQMYTLKYDGSIVAHG